jgi:cytochrome c
MSARRTPALWLAIAVSLAACDATPPRAREDARLAAEGRQVVLAAGCGACHVIPGVPGATGLVGPPLAGLDRRVYLAGRIPNTAANLAAWIRDPQRFVPATAMPPTHLSRADADAVAAFLLVRR